MNKAVTGNVRAVDDNMNDADGVFEQHECVYYPKKVDMSDGTRFGGPHRVRVRTVVLHGVGYPGLGFYQIRLW